MFSPVNPEHRVPGRYSVNPIARAKERNPRERCFLATIVAGDDALVCDKMVRSIVPLESNLGAGRLDGAERLRSDDGTKDGNGSDPVASDGMNGSAAELALRGDILTAVANLWTDYLTAR